jgi:hypothetical protein
MCGALVVIVSASSTASANGRVSGAPAADLSTTGQADQRLAVSFQLGRSSSDMEAS